MDVSHKEWRKIIINQRLEIRRVEGKERGREAPVFHGVCHSKIFDMNLKLGSN